MKKTIGLSLSCLLLIAISFGGCDWFDSVDDVSFGSTLEEDISVAEDNSGENVAYEKTIVLDATADPDIDKYKSKIKGFKINNISYQVTGYDGLATTFNGSLAFGDASSTSPQVLASITNLNLQTAFLNGTVFDLSLSQGDVDTIAGLLKDDKAVKLYLTGTLSQTPVYFTVHVILDVTVEADAL
ncbi:MAG: hypothetical protein HC859_16260 [Bacteroidia bacterium]|nr:hypothetical protein [Bacteroidia bacterium]